MKFLSLFLLVVGVYSQHVQQDAIHVVGRPTNHRFPPVRNGEPEFEPILVDSDGISAPENVVSPGNVDGPISFVPITDDNNPDLNNQLLAIDPPSVDPIPVVDDASATIVNPGLPQIQTVDPTGQFGGFSEIRASDTPVASGPQAARFHPGNNGNNNQNNQNFLACGYSCSRQTTILTNIEGVFSSAACSDRNADPSVRCNACCGAYALANGLFTTSSAGFPSTNGRECICCINNDRC